MSHIKELSVPQLTKRRMLQITAGAGTTLLAGVAAEEAYAQFNAHRPKILGFTFSPWQCENLGLPVIPTLKDLLNRLNPNVVRLGTYWDRTEAKQGQFNFKELEDQLDEIAKTKSRVILTAGMK